jgi:hypothetical protein
MKDLLLITRTGKRAVLSTSTLERFSLRIRGDLMPPGNGSYEEARKLWNWMINRRPDLIAQCSDTFDVIQRGVLWCCRAIHIPSLRGRAQHLVRRSHVPPQEG